MQTLHAIIAASLLANGLAACTSNDISRMLNGTPANADSTTATQRHPYGAQGSITESEASALRGLQASGTMPDANGIYHFTQPQSRRSIISRIGYPATYQGNSDYYTLADGEAEIIYKDGVNGKAIGFRKKVGNDAINRMANGSNKSPRHYYGIDGSISSEELPALRGLQARGTMPDANGILHFAQPQSRHAITSRLGYPATYQGNSDYYTLSDGEAEIIYKDGQNGRAIGVRLNPIPAEQRVKL